MGELSDGYVVAVNGAIAGTLFKINKTTGSLLWAKSPGSGVSVAVNGIQVRCIIAKKKKFSY